LFIGAGNGILHVENLPAISKVFWGRPSGGSVEPGMIFGKYAG